VIFDLKLYQVENDKK